MTAENWIQQVANTQEHLLNEPEELLKTLIQTIFSSAPANVIRNTAAVIDEVIFELVLDDAEYYVMRRKAQPEKTINLSPRELAIAQLIAQGLPNKIIGNRLKISPCTVSTHLRRIFNKLGVTSRAAMVARLMEERIVLSAEC